METGNAPGNALKNYTIGITPGPAGRALEQLREGIFAGPAFAGAALAETALAEAALGKGIFAYGGA